MPFPYSVVCDLLQDLDNDQKRKCHGRGSTAITKDWFTENRGLVHKHDVDPVALLSTLLPERRTDRVFSIKEKSLERIVSTACGLGSRKELLRRWETTPRAGLDFAECVEDVLAQAPNDVRQHVSVEEIDTTLHQLASAVCFSSPAVRSSRPTATANLGRDNHLLASLFRRLSPRDAKWLCRIILKNLQPVVVPESTVYASFHYLLPSTLKIHDDFAVAVDLLKQHVQMSHARGVSLNKSDIPKIIKPKIGVKVGRQKWLKARGIKHCLDMGQGWMSCEAKMDGEYCQVHVDLSKGRQRIQIFSKSGKDSTMDRFKLHPAVETSLGIGTKACKFKERCILEGELVVYSALENKILGFEKIRKHINRSGRFIGTSEDSQAHAWEHLMIVWFDVLLVDDESMLSQTHSVRRKRLASMVRCKEGQAALVASRTINFSSRTAGQELREAFASCIMKRDEGLVLKADEPYFSFGVPRRMYESCCLKLKKGYIKDLGDVGDFAVVGARHDPTAAKVLGLPYLKFTHFYLGCLKNKEMAIRFQAKPIFKVVNEVELNSTMAEYFFRHVFVMDVLPEENDKIVIEAPDGIMKGKQMTSIFLEPAVFDMTCFDFQQEGNTHFWSLRFPYVTKVHTDRQWKDCVSFDELQSLAQADDTRTSDRDSQELLDWIEKLEDAESKRRHQVESQIATQASQRSAIRSFVHGPGAKTVSPSGAASAVLPEAPRLQASEPGGRSPPRKRRREPSTDSFRRAKPQTEAIDLTASPSPHGSQQSARQPLGDITSATSSQTNGKPASTPQLPPARFKAIQEPPTPMNPSPIPARLPNAASFQTASAFSSPCKAPSRSEGGGASISPTAPVCSNAGATCALIDYVVLLSPCIANVPWLHENLLPNHGVRAVFKDIASWHASIKLQTDSSAQRKLVLVEAKRIDETKAFLRKLNGGVGRVLAYDWRLVEAITEVEQAQKKSDGKGTRQKIGTGAHLRELWARFYVGVC